MCNTNSNSINFAPLSGEGDNEEEGVEEDDVSGLLLILSDELTQKTAVYKIDTQNVKPNLSSNQPLPSNSFPTFDY